MHPVNERRCYNVTTSCIGWAPSTHWGPVMQYIAIAIMSSFHQVNRLIASSLTAQNPFEQLGIKFQWVYNHFSHNLTFKTIVVFTPQSYFTESAQDIYPWFEFENLYLDYSHFSQGQPMSSPNVFIRFIVENSSWEPVQQRFESFWIFIPEIFS